MNKLLVICGPTATGKTALAIKLAQKFNGELVSADSRQVYRGMDIGTGKDFKNKLRIENACLPARQGELKIEYKEKIYEVFAYDMEGVPLWMYDVVDPDEAFSVSHYQYFASNIINNIHARGKLPIVVGGTGLYIQSLFHPLQTIHIAPNMKLRQKLETKTLPELQKIVQKEYPKVWQLLNISDRQNARRLVRKIEIAQHQKVEGRGQKTDEKNNNDILLIGLTAPLPILYERIDQRVEMRVKMGIIEEIQDLLNQGYTWDLPAMSGMGYREWKLMGNGKWEMGNGRVEEIIQKWKWDEHGYARRQMTWFKKQRGIIWFDIESGVLSKVEKAVRPWYTKL